jgi:hypothetical protein
MSEATRLEAEAHELVARGHALLPFIPAATPFVVTVYTSISASFSDGSPDESDGLTMAIALSTEKALSSRGKIAKVVPLPAAFGAHGQSAYAIPESILRVHLGKDDPMGRGRRVAS